MYSCIIARILTHFMPLISFYTSQESSEIADVFRGYTKRPVALNGLIRVSFVFLNMDKIAISSNNEDQKNQPLYGKKYPGTEQVKFVEDSY